MSVVRSTHEPLNATAVQAAQRMVLTPALVQGRPVKVWLELPIGFAPQDDEPAAPPAADVPPTAPDP